MTGDQDVPCDEDAAHSFVWPGRSRAFICESHYKRLVKIADALGLPIESLDVQPVEKSE